MALVSKEWKDYIDVEPPRGCHFHIDEVDDNIEQLSLSGSWWTGKFHGFPCLLKKPHAQLIINRKTNVCIEPSQLHLTPKIHEEYITRVAYVNEIIANMVIKYDLSDPKLFDDDVHTPWDFIDSMGITHLFHSFLEEASWDDFQAISGLPQYCPSACGPHCTH